MDSCGPGPPPEGIPALCFACLSCSAPLGEGKGSQGQAPIHGHKCVAGKEGLRGKKSLLGVGEESCKESEGSWLPALYSLGAL